MRESHILHPTTVLHHIMNNKPTFQITNKILELLQDISYELGILVGSKLYSTPVKLRKNNQIKTLQSSLAIEGNSLSIEQVTDLINGKRVLAPEKDILEVKNAIELSKLTLCLVLNIVKMENAAVVAYSHLKALTLFGKPFYRLYLQSF